MNKNKKNKVFSAETMALAYHMRLSACETAKRPEWAWMWASSQKKTSTGWKMFPVRAGRRHFSPSNFQMQGTEGEMSACVRFKCVFFHVCVITGPRSYPVYCVSISLTTGAKTHGRDIISTFARLVDCLKDLKSVPNCTLLYVILNIWSVQIAFTLKGMRICSVLLVQLNTV